MPFLFSAAYWATRLGALSNTEGIALSPIGATPSSPIALRCTAFQSPAPRVVSGSPCAEAWDSHCLGCDALCYMVVNRLMWLALRGQVIEGVRGIVSFQRTFHSTPLLIRLSAKLCHRTLASRRVAIPNPGHRARLNNSIRLVSVHNR